MVVVVGSIIVWSRCMAIGVKISNHQSCLSSPPSRAGALYGCHHLSLWSGLTCWVLRQKIFHKIINLSLWAGCWRELVVAGGGWQCRAVTWELPDWSSQGSLGWSWSYLPPLPVHRHHHHHLVSSQSPSWVSTYHSSPILHREDGTLLKMATSQLREKIFGRRLGLNHSPVRLNHKVAE